MTIKPFRSLLPHEVREIAVAAEVSPCTVLRYIENLPITGLSRTRIERGLERLGKRHLLRATEALTG